MKNKVIERKYFLVPKLREFQFNYLDGVDTLIITFNSDYNHTETAFDYTFDCVVRPLYDKNVCKILGVDWNPFPETKQYNSEELKDLINKCKIVVVDYDKDQIDYYKSKQTASKESLIFNNLLEKLNA
jgi:hypothetical protein